MNRTTISIFTILFLNITSLLSQDSISQPEIVIHSGVEYEIIRGNVRFTVDTKGKIKNIDVYKVNCNNCSKNDVDSYKLLMKQSILHSPAWTPGIDSLGNKVSVDYNIPVKIEVEKRKKKKRKNKVNS